MKKIYVINGYPQSGKTLFGELVGKELKTFGINFLHTSTINPVKEVLMPYKNWRKSLADGGVIESILKSFKTEVVGSLDWDGKTKDEFWRKAMSDLKLKLMDWNPSLIDGLVWGEIKNSLNEPYVAFVDCREPKNIEHFIEHINNVAVGVDSAKIVVENGMSVRANNVSDLSVEETEYDIRIENPRHVFQNDEIALFFLKSKARAFVESEILGRRQIERVY